MAKRRKRTIPNLVTNVSRNLRIINGDIESLSRFRKPGRPKKIENLLQIKVVGVTTVPDFPGAIELRDSGMRDGFRLVRHRARKEEITRKNRSLQARFDDLCSDVKIIDPLSWEYADIEARFNSGKVSRIEKSVPSSFCSCSTTTDEEEQMSCLVHGLKRTDCSCGGINGITGYRMCSGHRVTSHMVGVVPFVTERMKVSKESVDKVARESGWM